MQIDATSPLTHNISGQRFCAASAAAAAAGFFIE
jgi:hypothetical protein